MKRLEIIKLDNLDNLTKLLLDELIKLKAIFENEEQSRKDASFFEYVKNETKQLFQLLDEWEKVATHFVTIQKLSLHKQQIEATKDNMRTLILHSYYKDVRKRRYMEIYKSCQFIFQQIIKEFSDERPTN